MTTAGATTITLPATPRLGTLSAPLAGPERAAELLRGRRIVALTGAGLSTDSGIPDYRGPDSPPRSPMTYDEFASGQRAQQRYWARSHIGWQRRAGGAEQRAPGDRPPWSRPAWCPC